MELEQQRRLWADELRAIADDGLYWSADNAYDQRRYQRVLRIAAEIAAAHDPQATTAIEQEYLQQMERPGRGAVTPLAVGDAAVFAADGRLLLIQRSDDRLWALPGGAFEVGETAAEGACREAWEETGLRVEARALLGVYDSRLVGSRSHTHLYHFVFVCRASDPTAEPVVSHETLAVGWFAEVDLPPLSPGHGRRIADAFRFSRGEVDGAIFDQGPSRDGNGQ
ncbi:MAG: NUDIX hydrolase [Herpetosiphon sp.]